MEMTPGQLDLLVDLDDGFVAKRSGDWWWMAGGRQRRVTPDVEDMAEAGWVDLSGTIAALTDEGREAMRRARCAQ